MATTQLTQVCYTVLICRFVTCDLLEDHLVKVISLHQSHYRTYTVQLIYNYYLGSTISSRKYTLLFHTTLRRGVIVLTLPPPPFLTMVHARSTTTTTATAFWKNSSFTECVLWEISGACVDTKCLTSEVVCKNLGGNEGGGCLFEGVYQYYWELMVQSQYYTYKCQMITSKIIPLLITTNYLEIVLWIIIRIRT